MRTQNKKMKMTIQDVGDWSTQLNNIRNCGLAIIEALKHNKKYGITSQSQILS